jgi:hypothetical protein
MQPPCNGGRDSASSRFSGAERAAHNLTLHRHVEFFSARDAMRDRLGVGASISATGAEAAYVYDLRRFAVCAFNGVISKALVSHTQHSIPKEKGR